MSRNNATAISPPTSTTRSRLCARPEVPPRDSLFRSVLIAVRDALSAGATLDTMAETSETSAAKSSTLVSRRTGTALIASLKLKPARTR